MNMETKQIVVPKFPAALWKQLKQRAAADDKTLRDSLTKAVEQYLEKSA